MKLPSVEEMLKAGMHFGHRTSRWHPKMAPYIFGARKGVHIIDLEKSREKLGAAMDFVVSEVAQGNKILFVGTKAHVKGLLKKTAQDVGMPYVSEHWIGGLLTNFPIIKKSIKRYKDLLEKRAAGKLTKYTKKEQLDFDREIAKLELRVGGLVDLLKTPDAVFIWDIKTEKTALAEAKKKGIPVIAICDTNVNPEGVAHIIPGNDDASKTIKLVLEVLAEAVLEGKNKIAKQETMQK